MLWLSSCIYVPPVWDAFDSVHRVDSIKPGVTTKEEVLQKFGQPDSKTPYYDPVDYTYYGYKSDGVAWVFLFGDRDLPLNQKRWRVNVHFDQNDVVSSISTSENSGVGRHPSAFRLRTNDTDPEWQKAKEASTYCPNADLGHADAQLHVGDILYLGVIRENTDLVRAWVWYSLAAQGGNAQAADRLSQVTAELTPEQVEEGKRQLQAWKPGQCMLELTPEQISLVDIH